jgi:PAS domain S-box-containing protein
MQTKQARLRELAGLLSARIDELRHQPPPAAQSLKQAFRTFADSVPTVIWTANREGYVTFFNRTYYDRFGAKDMDWMRLVHPDDKASVQEAWEYSVRTGGPYRMSARVMDAEGVYHPVVTSAQPVKDEAGEIVYWMGSSIALDERASSAKVA